MKEKLKCGHWNLWLYRGDCKYTMATNRSIKRTIQSKKEQKLEAAHTHTAKENNNNNNNSDSC